MRAERTRSLPPMPSPHRSLYVALWFCQHKEEREGLSDLPLKRELIIALQRLPISFGMGLRSREKCKKIAAELAGKSNMLVLGKGYAELIATRAH